jgi:hypothetical protein
MRVRLIAAAVASVLVLAPVSAARAANTPTPIRRAFVSVVVFENGRLVVEDIVTAREAGQLAAFVVRTRPFVPGCAARISLFDPQISEARISLFGQCASLAAGIVRVLESFPPTQPVVFGTTPGTTTTTPGTTTTTPGTTTTTPGTTTTTPGTTTTTPGMTTTTPTTPGTTGAGTATGVVGTG